METIKKENLKEWLINEIYHDVTSTTTNGENPVIDKKLKEYPRDAVEVIVNSEYVVDFGYDERELIPISEAKDFSAEISNRIISTINYN